jgi:hypothetical protein
MMKTVSPNCRVLIEPIAASDTAKLREMQQKINHWITIGLLIKYEIHVSGAIVIFNIALKKEA